MPRPKVVQLTSVHGPGDPRIVYKESQALSDAGYEVVLILPHQGPAVSGPVRVRPVRPPRNRWERMTGTMLAIARAALAERAAVYHFHDPELMPVGLLLKLCGRRVIYDVHEDVPLQLLTKEWLPRSSRRIIAAVVRLLEAVSARLLDATVAATPAIARRFPPARCATVQNFPALSLTPPVQAPALADREPILLYVGGITRQRGAREMVTAVGLLPPRLGARLVLVGRFQETALERELQALPGWSRTQFVGWQDPEGIRHWLGRARIGLALLHPIPNYVACYSTKCFEYMQAGLPVVASHFPLWREVIGGQQAGLLVDPLDPAAVAEALQYLLEHPAEAEQMGLRGKRAVRERYNWEGQKAGLLALYRRLAGPAGEAHPCT